ncbi:MAG: PEP-CTERM sorting domain-containing protein [Alphaproteobacteria bacterium]
MFAARGDTDETMVAENVPAAIRKAREQGAKAREKAVQETIINEMLGKYAKDRGWGQGGPYFPLGSNLLNVKPREKPIRTASTYEMGPAFAAMPLSVANPITSSLFGPGEPGSPPHQSFLETFQNPFIPVVPEPATWAMFILGFWALALGALRRRRTDLGAAAKRT